ncbi:peptidase [Streptomyces sp. NPDC002446]
MTTQDEHRFWDLDAIAGNLDDDADTGAAEGGADGAAPAALAASARRSFQVAPGHRLKVRKGPSTAAAVVRVLAEGAWIQINCQRRGQRVSGPYGTTDIWDNIAPGQFVSDAYVKTGSSGPVAPKCTS